MLLDAESGALRPEVERVLAVAQSVLGQEVQPELLRSQIEVGTPPRRSLAEVRSELVRLRREVQSAAQVAGCRIGAAGTHPLGRWQHQLFTPKERYLDLAEHYQHVARETLIFGCHVHVGITDKEAAIAVMNRTRPWLPTLLALSANSPFWEGADTGYASFRTEVFRRWPTTGIPRVFESRADFDDVVAALVASGAIEDGTKLYWDVRPSARYDTLEFRATDVCLTVDEAVMVAGLIRGLVRTCHGEVQRGAPLPLARPEVLKAALWQAARFGVRGNLIDPVATRPVPAAELVGALLDLVRPSLEEAGEWDEVSSLVSRTLHDGTGADRQRRAHDRRGSIEDVVVLIMEETAKGLS
jgi:carboxylate-amine ligase